NVRENDGDDFLRQVVNAVHVAVQVGDVLREQRSLLGRILPVQRLPLLQKGSFAATAQRGGAGHSFERNARSAHRVPSELQPPVVLALLGFTTSGSSSLNYAQHHHNVTRLQTRCLAPVRGRRSLGTSGYGADSLVAFLLRALDGLRARRVNLGIKLGASWSAGAVCAGA